MTFPSYARALEASVDSALELYSETLTHKDWVDLRILLLKGVLLTLQSMNEATKEADSTFLRKRDHKQRKLKDQC